MLRCARAALQAAKKSLQEFLEFIPAFVQAAVGQPAALAVPAPPPLAALGPPAIPAAAGAGRGSAAAAAEAEQFYDAQELPLPPFPVAAAAPGRGMSFEDAALLYLRYQCRTGDQSVALLQASSLAFMPSPCMRGCGAPGPES